MNLLQSYITQHVPELGRDKTLTQTRQYYDYILDKYPDDVVRINLPNNPTNTLNFSTNALQRFTRLEIFYCHNSNLTSLPLLPNGLQQLVCFNNNLTSLPPLPNGLLELWCSANNLTSLPPLPNGLLALWCAHNNLTSLPPLPNGLLELYCTYNNLTSLPPLPNGLKELWCETNRLTALPLLPITLHMLTCSNNLFPQSYGDIDDQYRSEPEIQLFNIKIHPELAPQTAQIMQQAYAEERRREQEEQNLQQQFQSKKTIQQLPNFEFGTNVGAITDCSNANDDDPISMDPINEAGISGLVKMSNGKCYYYEDLKRWASQNPIFPDTRQELTPDDLALLGLLKPTQQAGGRRRKRKTRRVRRRSARRRKRRTRARAKV